MIVTGNKSFNYWLSQFQLLSTDANLKSDNIECIKKSSWLLRAETAQKSKRRYNNIQKISKGFRTSFGHLYDVFRSFVPSEWRSLYPALAFIYFFIIIITAAKCRRVDGIEMRNLDKSAP